MRPVKYQPLFHAKSLKDLLMTEYGPETMLP
jgi:hypothetical protein